MDEFKVLTRGHCSFGGNHRLRIFIFEASQNKRLCFFERGDGGLPADSRVLLQKFIQRLPAFQIVKERLERDARAAENRFPAVDFRILATITPSEIVAMAALQCAS